MAGAVACLAVAGAATVGLFLLPVALLLVVLVAGRVRGWPESLGALEGIAGVALFIGFTNLGSTPCGTGGTLVLKPGQHEVGCGGLAAGPFLVVGVLLAILAAGAYWRARRAYLTKPG